MPRRDWPWVLGLFGLSGFAGLTYEVLWQRELGLLFGNTTHATATTLAVFFLGLAVGSWWIGRRTGALVRPLRTFAWLEFGAALGALLLPLLLPVYRGLFGPLYAALGDAPAAFLLVKAALATVVLGPTAILMGGTLPVLGELAARGGRGFARSGSLLYGVNTAGAVVGALAAGFVLPRFLGYRGAYGVALCASLIVGAVAWWRSRGSAADAAEPAPPERSERPGRPTLLWLAALSGFVSLGLEVLWTRLYALVFINSVYSFAAVLATFLAALAAGAWVAGLVGRRSQKPWSVLRVALLAGALAVVFSGVVLRALVANPVAVGSGTAWTGYVLQTFGMLAAFLLPPALFVGFVFPFLLRVEEERGGRAAAGARLGALVAANTLGALTGALAAGFLLPGLLGTWRAIGALGLLYAVAAVFLQRGLSGRARLLAPLAAVACVALLGFVVGGGPQSASEWTRRSNETIVQVYEGSGGTVSVVSRGGDLKLKYNESYTLGGTSQPRWEAYQAHIPLCLHGNPKRVCFLGLGTGITAGAALLHDVELVRVAEIVPDAVRAAREHFYPWTNELFEDPRAEIVIEDARTVLIGSPDTYDVVVGDLFLPWKRGTALLYTVEQFEAVRNRLAPGGVFAQWLALYQMSEAEFHGIARGFLEVFPNARVWRGDFFAARPIVALVGRNGDEPLDAEAMMAAWRKLEAMGAVDFGPAIESLPFLLQAGALAAGREVLERQPPNTDERPWLQFESPVSQRERAIGRETAFVASKLAAFERRLFEQLPVEEDPYLARLTPAQRRFVQGGMFMYEYAVRYETGDSEEGRGALAGFIRNVPSAVRPPFGDWMR